MTVWNNMELEAVAVLEKLGDAGFEAFFVGGYVRDKLLNRPIKDIDIATSAKPEKVIELFAKTIPTGLKHGTVTVMIGNHPYEVTTFRKEGGYEDYRRPTEVEFISNLEEDLKRRDFTMNAMAMDSKGHVIDPFGGQDDLNAAVLRCVGRAQERFEEDALRMMRCVRFASTYKLAIEEATWTALLANCGLLRHVAMERVRMELERMMSGPDPVHGMKLLADSGLLACTKSASALPWTRWTAAALPERVTALDRTTDPLLRWMLVYGSLSLDADEVREAMSSYTFSLKEIDAVVRYVGMDRMLAERYASSGENGWKTAAVQFGREAAEHWIAVAKILPHSIRFGIDTSLATRWLNEIPAFHVKELAVTGKEIIDASDNAAGPWVSRVQQQLLYAAALGQVANDKQALLELARQLEREAGAE